MRSVRWVLMCVLAMALPFGASAQDREQTLADIRQELTVLYVEIQRLKREFNTTGSPQVNAGGATFLDRVDTIEAALQKLTAKTEELEFRISRIVEDGTNRIGDLEFRLVELEGGDLSTLGETTTLGGIEPTTNGAVPLPSAPQTDDSQLAATERQDFELAEAALSAGDYAAAAQQFADFNQTYPGGPLAAAAELRRGEALEGLGDTREAARAYLEGFSVDQQGALAAEALFRLGRALGELGQTNEACVTLGEVGARFPGHASTDPARDEMLRLGCS